ncbi:MAG: flagellar biosynthetic protein FliO [Planctomycetota bacterium]
MRKLSVCIGAALLAWTACAQSEAIGPEPPASGTEPNVTTSSESAPLGEVAESLPAFSSPRESLTLGSVPEAEAAPAFETDWTRWGLSLGGVVVFAIGLGAVAKRLGRRWGMLGAGVGAPSGVLEVLARYPLSRHQTLMLLKLDQRVLLVAQTLNGSNAGLTTLTEVDRPEEVASLLLKTRNAEAASLDASFRDAIDRHIEPPRQQAQQPASVYATDEGDRVELNSRFGSTAGSNGSARSGPELLAALRERGQLTGRGA